MPSSDPTIELAKVRGAIDRTQSDISVIEEQIDAAHSLEAGAESLQTLLAVINGLKASLGELRVQESFWTQEAKEEQTSRKALGELAKG